MNKRITIKEIAKVLGVSVSTVSKALHDSYEISAETKKRVQEYAKAHNYKPNSLALSLQNKRTKTIGVLVPNILNTFFARVLNGIENEATKHGYKLITCFTNESYQKEVDTIEMLANGTIDGFLACLSQETLKTKKFDHFQELAGQDIPLVLYDRVSSEINCDKVVIDNVKSAYKATKYLMNLNCKHIAFISTIHGLNVGKFRAKGYKKVLKKYDHNFSKKNMVKLESKENLRKNIEKLLENDKIDGIFTVDETSAATAIQVLNKLGKRVPEDVSLIGFTNGILSRHISPPLTTVNQFGNKIGENATRMLIERLENKNNPEPYTVNLIRTEIIERKSTRRYVNKA